MQEKIRKTLLYGGAFDPPTNAHAAIVKGLAELARNEQYDLWLMPSGSRRDKSIESELALRVSYMYALLASGETYGVETRIETSELERDAATETHETHTYLSERYPDREFTWVFGSDSVNTMRAWRCGTWLLDNLNMVIVERPGYELQETPKRHTVLHLGEMAISSSQVRRRLLEQDRIDDIVPPPVIGVMKQSGALA